MLYLSCVKIRELRPVENYRKNYRRLCKSDICILLQFYLIYNAMILYIEPLVGIIIFPWWYKSEHKLALGAWHRVTQCTVTQWHSALALLILLLFITWKISLLDTAYGKNPYSSRWYKFVDHEVFEMNKSDVKVRYSELFFVFFHVINVVKSCLRKMSLLSW